MNSNHFSHVRVLPDIAGILARPLPLLPLEIFFNLTLNNIIRRNPDLFSRLGEHAGKTYALAMTDLPFCILLETVPEYPRMRVKRNLPQGDKRIAATISGSFLAHLRMITGQEDADALFFSREIVISGDIGAALALRNAVDDMSIALPTFYRETSPS